MRRFYVQKQMSFFLSVSPSAIERKKKTSLRVSSEAVRNALKETQREASADALPLHSAVLLETSHISLDDRFAAQNCLGGGSLPAYIPVTFY